MNGIELITKERTRQIEKEGWTSEHDDTHNDGAPFKMFYGKTVLKT